MSQPGITEVGIEYRVEGVARSANDLKTLNLALREQATALGQSSLALQKQIFALKAVDQPNKQLIATKMQELKANQLATQEVRQNIAALNNQARAAKLAAGETEALKVVAISLGNVFKELLAPLLAVGAVFSAGQILKTADDFNQLTGKIKNSLDSASEFDGVFKQLVDSSNRSGQSIDGVAQAFVRLRPAAATLGVTNQQLIKFNETFAKMGALAGATAEETKNALIQLSQGIASGRLQGDELRSVMESMPQVARTIAKSMGLPFDQFRKAASEGKVTADQVFKAIIAEADKTDAAFAKLPGSISRSLNSLGNAFQILIGGLNQANGVTDSLSSAIQHLAQMVSNATPEIINISRGFTAFLSEVFRGLGLLAQAALEIGKVAAEVVGLGDAFRGLMGVNLTDYLFNFADGLDVVTTGFQKAIVEARRFKSSLLQLIIPLQSDAAYTEAKSAIDSIADSKNTTIDFAYRARQAQRVAALNAGRRAQVASPSFGASGGIRSVAPATKKKKGKSDATIDREHIQDVQRNYEHQIAQMRDSSELAIKQQGPFADQGNILKAKLTEEKYAASLLSQELSKLQSTSVKTADGKRALNEAISKTKDELAKEKVSVQEASNAWEKYKVEQQETDFKRTADLQVASIQFVTEQTIKGEDEQASVEAQAYANRKTTINDFYDEVQEHIRNKAAAEQAAYEQTSQLIEDEIALIKKLEGVGEGVPFLPNAKIKDLRASQQKLYLQNENAQAGFTAQSDQAKQQLKQDLTQASRDFGQALQGDISQALQDAFSGSNPLQVIKNFAKSLYQTIVQSLSQALAAGFAKSQIFQQITDSVGNFINKVSKNTNSGQGPSTGGLGSTIKSFFSGGKTTVMPDPTGGHGVPFITPQAAQAASGSAGIGAVAGAAAFAIPLMAAQSAIAKGGSVGQKYVNFIDPLGFRKLLGFGGSSKAEKQAKRDAYHQNVLAPYLNNVVSNANPDNLDDLNASFRQAANGMKSNGSSGQALKQQAMQQIKQLIEQREKAIDSFIKTTKQQNEDLADNIALNDAKPIEKAAMERDIELKKIQRETDALLEQYKDSETAKTEILQQESLKRQQLLQDEQADFKSKTQDLADLLTQRDDIANANVFTRLRSNEQVKADQLTALDAKIAQAALELKGMQAAGMSADSLGSNQILQGLSQINNNNLQITINESNDPNKTTEAIQRALAALNLKVYGAATT